MFGIIIQWDRVAFICTVAVCSSIQCHWRHHHRPIASRTLSFKLATWTRRTVTPRLAI